MKVYSTKHWETDGIRLLEVEQTSSESMVKVGNYGPYLRGEGREWHLTFEGAKERAEELRLRKIESLKRKLGKLEMMRF